MVLRFRGGIPTPLRTVATTSEIHARSHRGSHRQRPINLAHRPAGRHDSSCRSKVRNVVRIPHDSGTYEEGNVAEVAHEVAEEQKSKRGHGFVFGRRRRAPSEFPSPARKKKVCTAKVVQALASSFTKGSWVSNRMNEHRRQSREPHVHVATRRSERSHPCNRVFDGSRFGLKKRAHFTKEPAEAVTVRASEKGNDSERKEATESVRQTRCARTIPRNTRLSAASK